MRSYKAEIFERRQPRRFVDKEIAPEEDMNCVKRMREHSIEIQLSKDELDCIREAAASPSTSQYGTSQTGEMNQIRGNRRPTQLPFPRPSSSSSTLLKQALANRITPLLNAPSSGSTNIAAGNQRDSASFNDQEGQVGKTTTLRKGSDAASEMSKSILTNPAWYRDQEGRTGFKPPGWEKHVGGKESAEIKPISGSNQGSTTPRSTSKSPTRAAQVVSPNKEKQKSSYSTPSLFCLSGNNSNSMTTSEYENLGEEGNQENRGVGYYQNVGSPKTVETKQKKSKSVPEISAKVASPAKSPKNSGFLSKKDTVVRSSKEKGFPLDDVVLDATTASAITGSHSSVVLTRTPRTSSSAPPNRGPHSAGHSPSAEARRRTSEDRRRDSSQSDTSKLSHKSVTFSDQVEVNEIERHQRRSRGVSNSSSEDESVVDLDEHLVPIRRALRDKKDVNSQVSDRPVIKISPAPDSAAPGLADPDKEIESLRVSSQSPLQRSASDIPEVSPTPISWSTDEEDRFPDKDRSTTPEFKPLPMPEGRVQLRETNSPYLPQKDDSRDMERSLDSLQMLQLNAPFPRPLNMSEDEWRTMIQSIYVAETSVNDFDQVHDARGGDNDSVHSYYLEDTYGPDIYQQIREHLPESVARVVREEMLAKYDQEAGVGGNGPNIEDWERMLIGSLTRLHAEDSDNGSTGTLTSANQQRQPGSQNHPRQPLIRSASGYLEDEHFVNQPYIPLNLDMNNRTGYDASAEISPTDSKNGFKQRRDAPVYSQGAQKPAKVPSTSTETVPTPTASHIPRPTQLSPTRRAPQGSMRSPTRSTGSHSPQQGSGKLLPLDTNASFGSQATARIDSSIERSEYSNRPNLASPGIRGLVITESMLADRGSGQSVKSPVSPATRSPSFGSSETIKQGPATRYQSMPSSSQIPQEAGSSTNKAKYTVRITSPQVESRGFAFSAESQPHQNQQQSMKQSFYDNVSSPNVLVTNVSVNLQPMPSFSSPQNTSVGVVKTRVITSTSNLPNPSAPSESQFSTLEARQGLPLTSPVEDTMRASFVRLYGNRKAPCVDSEGEEAPKDPKPTQNRRQSHDSAMSTDSRESVVSAVSYRAENKVRRYFNY